ncbi:MAG: tetratricopeptide repeat protein [Rickettsiales bacterium]|jgi:hypothetical protein|nr:tetratricopeptide repeat protein [Rickettsiales bacterium]
MVKAQKRPARKTLEEHSEDALYREVWEEVHMQRLYDFIRHNAKYIIAAALLFVVFAAGLVMVRSIRRGNAMETAANYESALDMNPELSREALSRLAKTATGGMGDLALFRAYQMALGAGDRADATAKLEKLAEDGSTRDFRDLALVQLAQLKADGMSADDFQKMLAPLLTKRSPFYYTGLLFVAEKYLSENKSGEARQFIKKITSEPNAPASIAAAAEMLLK